MDKPLTRSLAHGIKWKLQLEDCAFGCQGAFVASVGLSENHNAPDAFFVVNSNIYRVDYNWNFEKIGSVATGSYPTFAETGGERPLLLIADGSNLYYYDLKNGGELKTILLPNRITEDGERIKPTHIQVVAGSLIVNDSGTGYAYYSIPYPLSQETRKVLKKDESGNVIYSGATPMWEYVQSDQYVFLDDYGTPQYKNGESNSDAINALYAIGPNLIVFGPKSIEFWQRGSSEYETWTRTSYTFNREIGLDAVKSVSSVNNQVCFISNGMNAGKAVFMIADTSFQKISETWLDEILDNSNTEDIIGFSYSRSNHSFYGIYIPSADGSRSRTFVYDLSSQEWSERSSRNSINGQDYAWNLIFPVWFNNQTVFGHIKDGNLVYLNDDFHREEINSNTSVPLIRQRQTPVILNNYQNFTFDELGIEMNCGTIKDYTISPKLQLELSEDGGYTFSNTLLEDCGKVGQYFYRVRYLSLGMQRLCVIRITFSEDMDLTLTNASIRVTPLSFSI